MNDNKILTLDEQNDIYSTLLTVAGKLSLLSSLDIETSIDEFFVDGIINFSGEIKKDIISCIDIISSKDI